MDGIIHGMKNEWFSETLLGISQASDFSKHCNIKATDIGPFSLYKTHTNEKDNVDNNNCLGI